MVEFIEKYVKPYAKAWVAIAGALVASILKAFPDNPDVQTWGGIIASFITAIVVYAVPNKEPEPDSES